MAKTKAQRYLALLEKGKTVTQVAEKFGVTYGTVYDAKRRATEPKYAKRRKAQAKASRVRATA